MKIAIEALGIHDYGGGRSATLNLLQNLLAIDQHTRYTIFLTRPEPALVARNLQQIIMPFENRFAARLVAQAYLPFKARQFDLMHFAKNLACFGVSTPTVVTMYDMTTLMHPELMPKIDVWYWQYIQPRSLRQANKVIAISNTTRQDIGRIYDLETEKVKVIHPSIHFRFKPAPVMEIRQIRKQYGLPEEYILHVGRLDRKNNISVVLEAFLEYCRSINPSYAGKLVIVGGRYPKSHADNLSQHLAQPGLQNKILFTGRIPDEDLPAIYSGARMAVMASKHEGFGLAAVEAMACGTPLIAHRTGAIPEVTGNAAIFIDNIDKDQLAQAIDSVLSSPQLQRELRQRGLERVRKYQNCQDAEQTLDLYESLK